MPTRWTLTSPLSLLAQAKKPVTPEVWPKPKPTTHDYAKWEKAIASFQEADAKSAPAKGSVLFVGSSTIVRWKTLAEDFPERVRVVGIGIRVSRRVCIGGHRGSREV